MTKNILLVGVGGQGTILTTKILSAGLVELGYDVKMSEIHGMSQRGGTVTTQLKFGEKVYAPNIGEHEADIIISFEKVEALRALPYLKKGGVIISDDREILSMPVLTGEAEYPENALDVLKETVGDVRIIKASEKALELGNIKAQNICLLGALIKVLGIDGIDWVKLVEESVPAKVKDINVEAFKAGFNMI
ncbi:MAG: indolepyruvate oxidoreductase subunit beta [Clostridia bacterium]|nr:indolepyruvate oxidoreductase subunit beta [Clostridia bacterium]